jgi:hypothetical protein
MPLAAETWTAAGIWFQCGRAASNWRQPFWHDVIRSAGQSQVPAMYAPVCWSANPWSLLGPSQVVPVNVMPLKVMSRAGAS